MNTADLTALLTRLLAEPRETEWLEFKATRLEPQLDFIHLKVQTHGPRLIERWG